MATRRPTYRTLRLLCANAAGMVGFLLAYALSGELAVGIVAGGIVGGIGYAASQSVAAYAGAKA